jgi:hypothetical protein
LIRPLKSPFEIVIGKGRDRRNAARRVEQESISVKDRALPHIGRDAVKISSPDGVTYFRRAGDIRSLNAKQGNSR